MNMRSLYTIPAGVVLAIFIAGAEAAYIEVDPDFNPSITSPDPLNYHVIRINMTSEVLR